MTSRRDCGPSSIFVRDIPKHRDRRARAHRGLRGPSVAIRRRSPRVAPPPSLRSYQTNPPCRRSPIPKRLLLRCARCARLVRLVFPAHVRAGNREAGAQVQLQEDVRVASCINLAKRGLPGSHPRPATSHTGERACHGTGRCLLRKTASVTGIPTSVPCGTFAGRLSASNTWHRGWSCRLF